MSGTTMCINYAKAVHSWREAEVLSVRAMAICSRKYKSVLPFMGETPEHSTESTSFFIKRCVLKQFSTCGL